MADKGKNENCTRTAFRPLKYRLEVEIDQNEIKIYRRKVPYIGKFKIYDTIPLEELVYSVCKNSLSDSSSLLLWRDWDKNRDKRDGVDPSDKRNLAKGERPAPKVEDNKPDKGKSDDELDADTKMHGCAYLYDLKIDQNDLRKLVSRLNKGGAEESVVLSKKFNECVMHTDKYLVHAKKEDVNYIPLAEMAFFTKSGKKVYCGYHRQLGFKAQNSEALANIEKLCHSKSKRLNASGKSYSNSGFHIGDETITLTKDALLYTSHSGLFKRKTESAYIPYSRLGFAYGTDGSIFGGKKINILGEQNVQTRYRFSGAKEILNTIGEKGQGVSPFSSSGLKYWFVKAPTFVMSDTSMIYLPNSLRKKMQDKEIKSYMVEYNNINVVLTRKRLFRKPFVIVVGRTSSIRKDQSGKDEQLIVPKMRNFSKFKDILKKHNPSIKFEKLAKEYRKLKDKELVEVYKNKYGK